MNQTNYSKYAFFDVDQTIYPGYSMSDFYFFLITKGLGGEWTIQKDREIGELYKSGKISYSEAGLRVSNLLAEVIKGKNISKISSLATEFIKLKGLKTFVPPLFNLLKTHEYQIILVSASLDAIIHTIGMYSKADSYFASTSEKINNKYTGVVLHQLDNEEKKNLISKQISISPESKIIAFGDSSGDIPMLSLADHAFVIDPHQSEMKNLVLSHENWYLTDENTIFDQVAAVLNSKTGLEK